METLSDDNDNDEWDEDEALNDDVGRDGLRPLDEGYTGPDEGEGDGIPTQGEPNFGMTDIDESDQIGLTSVDIFATHEIEPKDDEEIWNSMANFTFKTELQQSLTSLIYGSGPIALPAGETRDFSIAMVFGENLDDLIRNKNTVQLIYNSNYSFFKPPLKPRLKAVPGDAKVTLYWDRRAEESVDVFLNFKKDFEGYKIYSSTDPSFLEVKVITNAYGNSVFRKPLATFAGAAGCVAYGFISDKLFNARRPPVTLIFSLLEVFALFIIFFTPSGQPVLLTIGFILYGFTLSGILVALGGLFAIDIAPKIAAGAAIGFIGVFSYIGAAVQDQISGLLIEHGTTVIDGTRHYDFGNVIVLWIGSSIISIILASSLWRAKVGN